MSKKPKTDKTLNLMLKLTRKTEKLRDRINAIPETPAAPKKRGGSLLERLGFAQQPVEKSVSDRFDRDFNARVPITLLVKYAMDAVDDGRIKLPSVAEAKREFNALVDAALARKGKGPLPDGDIQMTGRILLPHNILTGLDDDGAPLPPEIMPAVEELRKALGNATAPVPFPFPGAGKDPLDVVKEAAEEKAPDAPNSIRFTNDPFETSHEG
jgi:hypothetical protein